MWNYLYMFIGFVAIANIIFIIYIFMRVWYYYTHTKKQRKCEHEWKDIDVTRSMTYEKRCVKCTKLIKR